MSYNWATRRYHSSKARLPAAPAMGWRRAFAPRTRPSCRGRRTGSDSAHRHDQSSVLRADRCMLASLRRLHSGCAASGPRVGCLNVLDECGAGRNNFDFDSNFRRRGVCAGFHRMKMSAAQAMTECVVRATRSPISEAHNEAPLPCLRTTTAAPIQSSPRSEAGSSSK